MYLDWKLRAYILCKQEKEKDKQNAEPGAKKDEVEEVEQTTLQKIRTPWTIRPTQSLAEVILRPF